MAVSNEDDRAPAVYSRLSNGLQHIDGFSHVAYCTGPFQLAYLLSALDVCGISPGQCTILPFPGSARNDDLKKTLVTACSHLGMQIADADLLPALALSDAFRMRGGVPSESRRAFWYCQGIPYTAGALRHLRKTLPNIVFEYYDGLGSHIAAFEQEKKRLSLSDARGVGDLRQLAVQRLMRPDWYFMPDDGLWARYASPDTQARTQYMALHIIQGKLKLVGDTLDDIDVERWPEQDSPDVILIMAKLSEVRREVALEDELRMYNDLLRTIRAVSKTASILAKTHPRSSPEKMHRLQEICARHDARLYTGQQLIEYIVEKSGRHDVTVIGPPSTSFLTTIQFNYGRAFCLSQSFMASYIGPDYGNDSWQTMHHQLMEVAGVATINSLPELAALLEERRIGR